VTRTLTIIYSTTLLSLFTAIQLTLLARIKYVQFILQMGREERCREKLKFQISPSMLILGTALNMLDDEPIPEEDEVGAISEEIESKYLTLSWWILHVGWKDVGERVRRGVEEVFDKCVQPFRSVLLFHALFTQRVVKNQFELYGLPPLDQRCQEKSRE
jgi:peroxin-3